MQKTIVLTVAALAAACFTLDAWGGVPKSSVIIRNQQGIRTGSIVQHGRTITFRNSAGLKTGGARIGRARR